VRPAQLVQLRLKSSNMHIDALWAGPRQTQKTNREVLHWVKEWDECVFGKKSVGIRKAPSPAFAGRGRGSSRGRGGYGTYTASPSNMSRAY
jgi:hypothetical protein